MMEKYEDAPNCSTYWEKTPVLDTISNIKVSETKCITDARNSYLTIRCSTAKPAGRHLSKKNGV